MKKIILILCCLLINNNVQAQANDAEAMLYNVSIGGVFCTIGALINKKPEDKTGKVIFKALAQGALGGLVTHESKNLLRETQQQSDWRYIWGAKILNAAATSMKENAAMNRDFWEKWHINIGFSRIEFETKDEFKMRYKVMPIAFAYTMDAFFRFDFSLMSSIKTGEFIFTGDLANAKGVALPGYIVLQKRYSDFENNIYSYPTITHELIHVYQFNDFSVLNTYYQKPLSHFVHKNKTAQQLDKYISMDLHRITFYLTHLYMSRNTSIFDSTYYNNYFEHEAGYYSNTLKF